MVREHVEAERQLERDRERRGEEREEEMVVVDEGDRDWDVVSTGSVDSIRLEDWKKVIVE